MVSNYKNAWERLVGENGLKRAKEIMAERRAKVNPKNIKGFHTAARKIHYEKLESEPDGKGKN